MNNIKSINKKINKIRTKKELTMKDIVALGALTIQLNQLKGIDING